MVSDGVSGCFCLASYVDEFSKKHRLFSDHASQGADFERKHAQVPPSECKVVEDLIQSFTWERPGYITLVLRIVVNRCFEIIQRALSI